MTIKRAMSRLLLRLRLVCLVALAVFTLSPALDGVVCAAEAPTVSFAPASMAQGPAPAGDTDHAVCPHGHAHCGAALTAPVQTAVVEPGRPSLQRAWGPVARWRSLTAERLDRPPRA
jgi:hypothetical protein